MKARGLSGLLLLWSLPALAASPPQLFHNLGHYHRPISTHSRTAALWFDQGLRLTFAFNHDEAQRSFEQAARSDSNCAIAWWGAALTLGPNINLPAMPDRAKLAREYTLKAVALTDHASPVERSLVGALQHRYARESPAEPARQRALDSTYAAAMREVARQFPRDDDVQVLFAESLMDLSPWNHWTLDGKPQPNTLEIVQVLETVLARNPTHPGANHYYIHAMEASGHPEKALSSARRVAGMMPGAGHLVHMPSHVYARVGRYAEASEANRKAIRADDEYVKRANPEGFYSMLVMHNHQFLWYTCMMEGRRGEALRQARAANAAYPDEMLRQMPGFDFVRNFPVFSMLRFGQWDSILAEPLADPGFPYARAIGHYARGVALAAQGRESEARAEQDSLKSALEATSDGAIEGLNTARPLLEIASSCLQGERALRRGDTGDALTAFEQAVALQDAQHYDEPPDWPVPVRHQLGTAYLELGRASEAESCYREDLRRNPANGWALRGLELALRAQGKTSGAAARTALKRAWKNADVALKGSAY